jgi:hypothetical protein
MATDQNNPTVFYNISTNPMELVLQARCSRGRAIAWGWKMLLFFNCAKIVISISILAVAMDVHL